MSDPLPRDVRHRLKAALREARKARGLTTAALGAAMGLDGRAVEEMERPNGPGPNLARYIQAAKIMDAPELMEPLVGDAGWTCGPPGRDPALRAAAERAAALLRDALAG